MPLIIFLLFFTSPAESLPNVYILAYETSAPIITSAVGVQKVEYEYVHRRSSSHSHHRDVSKHLHYVDWAMRSHKTASENKHKKSHGKREPLTSNNGAGAPTPTSDQIVGSLPGGIIAGTGISFGSDWSDCSFCKSAYMDPYYGCQVYPCGEFTPLDFCVGPGLSEVNISATADCCGGTCKKRKYSLEDTRIEKQVHEKASDDGEVEYLTMSEKKSKHLKKEFDPTTFGDESVPGAYNEIGPYQAFKSLGLNFGTQPFKISKPVDHSSSKFFKYASVTDISTDAWNFQTTPADYGITPALELFIFVVPSVSTGQVVVYHLPLALVTQYELVLRNNIDGNPIIEEEIWFDYPILEYGIAPSVFSACVELQPGGAYNSSSAGANNCPANPMQMLNCMFFSLWNSYNYLPCEVPDTHPWHQCCMFVAFGNEGNIVPGGNNEGNAFGKRHGDTADPATPDTEKMNHNAHKKRVFR